MKKIIASIILMSLVDTFASAEISTLQCQQKIKSLLCEVAPPTQEKDRYTDSRKCLPTKTDFYAKKINRAFLLYPDFVKLQFCSVKKIYIEQNFFGPAWSAPVDEKNPKEFLIGLRKQDLDKNINLEAYASWFEQQSFGGNKDFELKNNFPIVKVNPKKKAKESFIIFTLLHELAHTFDYQHQFNISKKELGYSTSWTNISWNDIEQVNPKFNFSYQKSFCLNFCNEKFLEPKKAYLAYEKMYKAGFISQLSSTNAMEDFAESFSYFVMSKYMGTTFKIHANGKTFYLNKILESPQFQKKRNFLEKTIKSLKK